MVILLLSLLLHIIPIENKESDMNSFYYAVDSSGYGSLTIHNVEYSHSEVFENCVSYMNVIQVISL